MKESPEIQKLEKQLRSTNISAFGFMGTDSRSLSEIINSDMSDLSELGVSITKIVSRMKEITAKAESSLGNWTQIDDRLQARVDEAKGHIICPWPHPAGCAIRITYVRIPETNQDFQWTDLNIHLIEEHNFFEGKGSPYRIEPKELVKIIF
ncbi:MAG: hypothetical protein A2Y10_07425 [Planctomycetes bacterium GWF2_41_51]|nr:MAG: hypothetical protein A2Y10_07425 [Planctomycetes bacterium GWF2_41_51]HBG27186.1 hypothetical protein [Phycisphaerales bacterium]